MLLTRANPEQEAKLRELIAGKPAGKPKAPKASPKRKREVQLVSQYVAPLRGGGWRVQLPMYLDSQGHGRSTARWVKAAKAEKQIATTLLALRSLLKLASARDEERAAIRGVTLVRISPSSLDDDNLSGVFKHVRDAVFAWIVCGERQVNMRAIGHYDATVKTGIHTCRYEQTRCEANPRAHGIQILLHV